MSVHTTARDSLRARGVRLRESTWKELEAVQLRRGFPTMQEAVREAVEKYIAGEYEQRSAA